MLDKIDKIKKELLNEIDKVFEHIDNQNLTNISILIHKNKKNKILFLGVGKNEPICMYFSDVLKSIGYNSFKLHYGNLTHGDLGCIRKKDIVFILSNSGNTQELVNSIKYINATTILVCSNPNGTLVSLTDHQLIIPKVSECDGKFGCIPTTSFSCFSLVFNLILNQVVCLDKTEMGTYNKYHPNGNIGILTTKVKEVMIKKEDVCIINKKDTIKNVMIQMSKKKLGCCFIEDENKKMYGIITDRDIRQCLVENECNILEKPAENICNTNYTYISDTEQTLQDIIHIKYLYVPIIDSNKNIIGLVQTMRYFDNEPKKIDDVMVTKLKQVL